MGGHGAVITNPKKTLIKNISKDLDGCWVWQKGKTKAGYGQITVRGETVYAHRLAYSLFVGDIPVGKEVCHKCDNPSCINPDHLFIGSHLENMHDAMKKGIKSGTPLTNSNVIDIRDKWAKGGVSQYTIADEYGVDQSYISRVVNKKRRA